MARNQRAAGSGQQGEQGLTFSRVPTRAPTRPPPGASYQVSAEQGLTFYLYVLGACLPSAGAASAQEGEDGVRLHLPPWGTTGLGRPANINAPAKRGENLRTLKRSCLPR